MEILVRHGDLGTRAAGAVAVGVFESDRALTGPAAAVDRASRGAIRQLLRTGDFTGRYLETALLYPAGARARRILVIGLGRAGEMTHQRIREFSGLAARRARDLGAGTLALASPEAGRDGLAAEAAAQAAVEGSILGHYRFTAYRSDPKPPALRRLEIVQPDASGARSVRDAVERGRRWAEATCLARDLAWIPGQDLPPEGLAARAVEVARASGARATVLRTSELERLGMGAVLAVGRGSPHPPCFIVLERQPGGAPPKSSRVAAQDVGAARGKRSSTAARRERAMKGAPGSRSRARPRVVIGKGATFDTGGISLKPRENMNKMKYDMSGAAAVLGLFSALPTIEHPFPVIGLIPAAENMPDGTALKPGDVLRTMDGTTVEVTNTDAEGRLLLADALAYARGLEPEAVVDLATLTGVITIALGHLMGGLFTMDERLAGELLDAAGATGERLWRMPLSDEYRSDLRSDTADLVNSTGAREGGAILAAAFLKHFARDLRWAHLDIASTAWTPVDRPHQPRGPTGFGARLLLEWVSRQSAAASPIS